MQSGPATMLPHWIIFWIVLLASCGYALWRGRRYERIAAIVFIAATVLSIIARSPLQGRYHELEISDLIIDSGVLVSVVAIALVSDRFWPLWAAGLQLVDSMAHMLKALQPTLIPAVYGAAERFWSYPILIILLIGAWRQHRRSIEEEPSAA